MAAATKVFSDDLTSTREMFDWTKYVREPAKTIPLEGLRSLKTIKFIHNSNFFIIDGQFHQPLLEVYNISDLSNINPP